MSPLPTLRTPPTPGSHAARTQGRPASGEDAATQTSPIDAEEAIDVLLRDLETSRHGLGTTEAQRGARQSRHRIAARTRRPPHASRTQ